MTIVEQRQSEFRFAVKLFVVSFFVFQYFALARYPLPQIALGTHGIANLFLANRTYRLTRTKFSPILSSLLFVVVCLPLFNLLAILAIDLFQRPTDPS